MINYMEPSDICNEYLKHFYTLIPACDGLALNNCFTIPKEGFEKQLSTELIDKHCNVEDICVVLIEHDEVFEIRRLPDNTNSSIFYRHLNRKMRNKNKGASTLSSVDTIKKVCLDYLTLDIEKCLRYDKKLTEEHKLENVISHVYIQRRVSSMKAFRDAKEGRTEMIKLSIDELMEEGFLEVEEADIVKSKINLYKINIKA